LAPLLHDFRWVAFSGGPSFPPVVRDSLVDVKLRLLTRGDAERVVRRRNEPSSGDVPWADGYPLDGDTRACAAYITQLPIEGGPEAKSDFGYYQILESGQVVGGIGFHGPPRGGVAEVGYGVVPGARGRGVAKAALRLAVDIARSSGGVSKLIGRTTEDNLASQQVMRAVGMRVVGRDDEFLHFEMRIRPNG
jgi:RimJ/RimL family protein N-acetyltransferase